MLIKTHFRPTDKALAYEPNTDSRRVIVRTTMVSRQQDGGMRVVGQIATMAQLVAQIICTDKVVGSSPACGSSLTNKR